VLPVGVDPDDQVHAALVGVAKPRLDGPADAEVEGQADHRSAVRGRDPRRPVRGAVVDDEHLEPRVVRTDLVDHTGDAALLVIGRHDGDPP
jgi:hypothetical protein